MSQSETKIAQSRQNEVYVQRTSHTSFVLKSHIMWTSTFREDFYSLRQPETRFVVEDVTNIIPAKFTSSLTSSFRGDDQTVNFICERQRDG